MRALVMLGLVGTCSAAQPFGWCYLKYSDEGRATKKGYTGCVLQGGGSCRYIDDIDFENTAGGRTIESAGAESCCALCHADAQCKAAVHKKNPDAGTTCSSNIYSKMDPASDRSRCEGFHNCGRNCGVTYKYPQDFAFGNEHQWYVCRQSGKRILVSNGIPSHDVTVYNPNDPCATNWHVEFPLTGNYTDTVTELPPLGSIGMQLDGVPMFGGQEDPFDGDSNNAVQPPKTAQVTDGGHWFGHTSPQKIWHYHAPYVGHATYPAADEHVGYALDGFKIYGAVEDTATLDQCNGRVTDGEYRYHIRKIEQVNATVDGVVAKTYCDGRSPACQWNYILGCYHGDLSQTAVKDARYATLPSDCVEEPTPTLRHYSHLGGRVIVARPPPSQHRH